MGLFNSMDITGTYLALSSPGSMVSHHTSRMPRPSLIALEDAALIAGQDLYVKARCLAMHVDVLRRFLIAFVATATATR